MRSTLSNFFGAVLFGTVAVGLAGCEAGTESPPETGREARPEFSASFEDFKEDFEAEGAAEQGDGEIDEAAADVEAQTGEARDGAS